MSYRKKLTIAEHATYAVLGLVLGTFVYGWQYSATATANPAIATKVLPIVMGSTPDLLVTGRGIHITTKMDAIGVASISAPVQISEAPNGHVFQSTAKTIDIVGTAGPDPGKQIKIIGVGDDFGPLEEILTLTAETDVTTKLFRHVNRTVFLDPVVNFGDISGTYTGGTDQAFFMPSITSISEGIQYMVPDDGHSYFLRRVQSTVEKATGSAIEIAFTFQENDTSALITWKRFFVTPEAPIDYILDVMIYFPPSTRFQYYVTDNDANGGDVNCAVQLVRTGGPRAMPDGAW